MGKIEPYVLSVKIIRLRTAVMPTIVVVDMYCGDTIVRCILLLE